MSHKSKVSLEQVEKFGRIYRGKSPAFKIARQMIKTRGIRNYILVCEAMGQEPWKEYRGNYRLFDLTVYYNGLELVGFKWATEDVKNADGKYVTERRLYHFDEGRMLEYVASRAVKYYMPIYREMQPYYDDLRQDTALLTLRFLRYLFPVLDVGNHTGYLKQTLKNLIRDSLGIKQTKENRRKTNRKYYLKNRKKSSK
jgi:hypothetical protein